MMQEKRAQCEKVFDSLLRRIKKMAQNNDQEKLLRLYQQSKSCKVRYAVGDMTFIHAKWVIYDRAKIRIELDLSMDSLVGYVYERMVCIHLLDEEYADCLYDYLWEMWQTECKKIIVPPHDRALEYATVEMKK